MPTPKPAYHRENLKEDLLAAAFAHVEAHGHQELSVRQLAQLVGVSPGAPYHHFPDRRSLLLAVALAGYDLLTAEAAGTVQLHLPGAEILAQTCHAFLNFCHKHSRLIELMYESELTRPLVDPAIKAAQQSGYQVLRNVVLIAAPHLAPAEMGARIATLWSALYGFALMRGRQMILPHDEIDERRADGGADAIVRQLVRMMTEA